MINGDYPFCDNCGVRIQNLTEDECLDDFIAHGWTDWKTAYKHYCYRCSKKLWEPPCDICRTHRCAKGIECWATPPLHVFPYETYYAENKFGPKYWDNLEIDLSEFTTNSEEVDA